MARHNPLLPYAPPPLHHDPILLPDACRAVARHYFGAAGVFAYAAFDYLNATYFDGALPDPLITWALTAHGRCLGATHRASSAAVITLHPSLLGGHSPRAGRSRLGDQDAVAPWGIPPDLLGPVLACDVLLHECIHLTIAARGETGGPSSHNNPAWIAEVNRLAPMVGLPDLVAGRSTTIRVPQSDAPPGPRGRPPTVVQRVSGAAYAGEPLPFAAVAGFPYAAYQLLGRTDRYRTGILPFPHPLAAHQLEPRMTPGHPRPAHAVSVPTDSDMDD